MRKVLVLILLACFVQCWQSLQAQSDPTEQRTFFYKDGSVFMGKVMREDEHQILLLASTGDTLHIDKNLLQSRPKKVKPPKSFYNKGIFASWNVALVSLNQTNLTVGYRFNEKYTVGLGTGFHVNYLEGNGFFQDNVFVPLYLYGRMYLSKGNKVKPFIGLSAGYSFPVNDRFQFDNHRFEGGVMIQPEIGLHFAGRGKSSFFISLGQSLQSSKGTLSRFDAFSNEVVIDYNRWYSNTVLKIGVEFR